MKVGLKKNELAVLIFWINAGNHALAPGMAIVQGGGEAPGNLVVGAQVADIGQASIATPWSARVPKRLRLKGATTQVPEIRRTGEPEGMHFGAQSQLRDRTHIQGAVDVLIIHHVVKRKARILSRRGQHLKECAVARIVGIPVSAPV